MQANSHHGQGHDDLGDVGQEDHGSARIPGDSCYGVNCGGDGDGGGYDSGGHSGMHWYGGRCLWSW